MKEPAYGYRVAADGIHIEEHAGEQMVITAIHECRSAGMSIREIEVKLAEHGFVSTGAARC
jgi:hypothetical protein